MTWASHRGAFPQLLSLRCPHWTVVTPSICKELEGWIAGSVASPSWFGGPIGSVLYGFSIVPVLPNPPHPKQNPG